MPPPSHSRQTSGISTSFTIRSSSPSPSGSGSPVSPSSDGLSRRLSWNRSHQDTLSVQDAFRDPPSPPGATAFTAPSRTNLMSDIAPVEEYDLGGGWASNLPAPRPGGPFMHQFQSDASLDSTDIGSSQSDLAEGEDQERLTPGRSSGVVGYGEHRRQPSKKVYGQDGLARSPGHTRFAASIGRNETFRAVSRTIRKASVRVVNILGADEDVRGMVRLEDGNVGDGERGEEGSEGKEEDIAVAGGEVPMPKAWSGATVRPDPLPPEAESALRGRTLCVFKANSGVRRAMHGLLLWPYTEPAILALIITNVVVLAIQASYTLNTPRADDGYFRSWEDAVLLVLFAIFTVEMFARIIVTGLIIDPEVTVHDSFLSPNGFIPTLELKVTRAQSTLRRNVSKSASAGKAHWRNQTIGTARSKKSTKLVTEAPFQRAVAKQQSLSSQGRPYLRHSWHRLDMIAVVAFWITFALALSGQEATVTRHIYIFRALSVLRAGRLLVITSGTTTILHSLKRAGPLLITVSFFLIFAGCLFSIIGVQSFRGSFRRDCVLIDPNNSSNVVTLSQQCGGFIDPFSLADAPYIELSGTATKGSSKGFVCPLHQTCTTTDSNPNGDTMSFDNVFDSLIQIVVIASINTWSQTMYAAMDSEYFSSSLFFIAAVLVLNFWLINLLVAVVVNTFKDIRSETRRSAFGANDSVIGSEPQWAADTKRRQTGLILRLYQRSELIWVAVVLADLVAQACKTSDMSDSQVDLLKNIELAFTMVFDLEMIIRIAGFFPQWRGFCNNGRNAFDLFLAVSSSIIQIPAIAESGVYPWLTVFQLLRWYRVTLAFPRMKPLLITVFGSFAGLLNMVIFLFLINFIGALVAVQLLRGDLATGETITFSQTYNAFLGMYQIFSSENWTTVLYDAMSSEFQWAQGWIAAIFLCGWFLFANFIVLQMFIAVINENFAVAEEQKRKQQIEAFIRRSEPVSAHTTWIDRFNPYRLMSARHEAIKFTSLPPNLVLPLKRNVNPDVGGPSFTEVKEENSGAKGAIRRLFGRRREEAAIPLRHLKRPPSTRDDEGEGDGFDDDRGLTDLLPPPEAGPSADEHMDALRERRNQEADFIAAHPTFDHSIWLFKQSNPVRRFCQSCAPPAHGNRIFGRPHIPILYLSLKTVVFCGIVASIAVAAIASPEYRKQYYEAHGYHRGTWFDLLEVALGMILVVEAGTKIIADGFIFAPNAYLLSLWNVLDFIILITLLVNTTTSLIYIGGLSRVTRSLKAFRALRLITLFSRLRDTLHAVLFAGALKILDASVLMMLYIIPFAVWGLNIFSGLLFTCNDSTNASKQSCIGEYFSSPLDDSLSFYAPRVWANPGLDSSTSSWGFDSFREAVLILFEIVSLEGWIDVMTSVMNIVGVGQQAQEGASQWNAIFLVLYNLFGAVIILTLFVSIIIGNFSTRSGNALLTTEQRQWVDLSKFIRAQTPSQLPKLRPQSALREWCYDRAVNKDGIWARGFTVIYYIHILLLMQVLLTQDFSDNILTQIQLDWVFLFLTLLYAIDLLIRFYGLGFKSFRRNGWNIFDLIVITGTFATTIPALREASSSGGQVVIQLQKLFLVSIALKLVQRVSSLNQLFKTSVASLPAIGNLFLLWATLFIFYSILFLEVFGLAKIGNNSFSRFQNYYSFGNTLVMLAFMSTGEGWNGYMHDYTISFPRCTESENFLLSDCGSASWSFGLFISWNILSMYIFANMFTGVVVESFAYVYQMPGGASLNREEMRAFKRVWSDFDTERTGYIRRKDFVKFFARLSGVFEVRPYPVEFAVPVLVRGAIPDPVDNAAGKLLVALGVRRAVDVRRVESQINHIDNRQVRERRQLHARLFNEARISEEPGRGISFTSMLVMLAHYKLIEDEKALQLDDLLVRRVKTERVTDMVNLDRVRGLLRTIYWRRRFLASRDERRRTLNAEAQGIPAIVLEPVPAAPPRDSVELSDHSPKSRMRDLSRSPPRSTGSSPSHSPKMRSDPFHPPDVSLGHGRHSPALSVASQRPSLGRQLSNSSMLSSDDAHYRRESPSQDNPPDGPYETMDASVWGDMMREAVDNEDA